MEQLWERDQVGTREVEANINALYSIVYIISIIIIIFNIIIVDFGIPNIIPNNSLSRFLSIFHYYLL